MAAIGYTDISCGIAQIFGLSKKTSVENIINDMIDEGLVVGIFSDNTIRGNGKRLAKNFKKLGYRVVKSKKVLNVNSNNFIETWIVTLKPKDIQTIKDRREEDFY